MNTADRPHAHTPSPPLRLPSRAADAHKGDFGRMLVIGGSRGMAGSIAMTASAALRSGAGLVTAAIPDRCLETVAAANLCVMTYPLVDTSEGQFAQTAATQLQAAALPCSALGIGPGMGRGSGSDALVRWALQQSVPRVIDADGLNLLAEIDNWPALLRSAPESTVLTPHPGEWQRLSDSPASDRARQTAAAQRLAAESGAVVVLKGAGTVITDGRQTATNATGNPGMASGGSGDCLTGVIATLLGQGLSAWDAALLGTWVHGRAGDRAAAAIGTAGMTALDLLAHLPAALGDACEG